MTARPIGQVVPKARRRRVWIALLPEQWQQVKYQAMAEVISEEEWMSRQIIAELGRVQWLKLGPAKR